MVKISKIKLSNYKSLRDVELELRPLNILIGRNGSGKSNLLDFFRLLKAGAEGQLARHINREGGFTDLRWWGEKQATNDVELSVTFDPKHISKFGQNRIHDEVIWYIVNLESRNTNYWITSETITSNRLTRNPLDAKTRQRYLVVQTGLVELLADRRHENIDDAKLQEIRANYRDVELYISQVRDSFAYPSLDIIREIFTDIVVYRGFGAEAINNVYQAQTLDALHPLRLEPDLSNLTSIIHALQNNAQYERAYEDLSDILDSAFPEISKLDTPQSAAGKIELRWRNTHFAGKSLPAMSLSDGMLRFLGLATLLTLPDPPAIIAIDEPEIGLHPKLIPLLAVLLKRASSRTQIIVTTHSPELLNSDDITLDDIVLVNKEDGATSFERPDGERLARWLERYAIGQLWQIGKLGQV